MSLFWSSRWFILFGTSFLSILLVSWLLLLRSISVVNMCTKLLCFSSFCSWFLVTVLCNLKDGSTFHKLHLRQWHFQVKWLVTAMSTCVVGVMRVLCVIFSFSFLPPIGFSFLIFHVNLLDNRGMGVWTNFSLHNPANGCRSTAQMALDMVLAYTFLCFPLLVSWFV